MKKNKEHTTEKFLENFLKTGEFQELKQIVVDKFGKDLEVASKLMLNIETNEFKGFMYSHEYEMFCLQNQDVIIDFLQKKIKNIKNEPITEFNRKMEVARRFSKHLKISGNKTMQFISKEPITGLECDFFKKIAVFFTEKVCLEFKKYVEQ